MRRLSQVLALLGLMLWPMEIHAQSEELTAAIEQAEKLFQAERFREAIPFLEKAVSLSEREFGSNDPGIAELLNALGYLYRYDGQYAKAEPLYKRILAIREETLGSEHLDVAASLNNLAVVYWGQSRYAEAEPLYKRALAIREKALGPDHQLVAASLNNLALLYDYQGRYAEAELLFKRSISITEKALGLDHPEVATSLDYRAAMPRQSLSTNAAPSFWKGLLGQSTLMWLRVSTTWRYFTSYRAATTRPSRSSRVPLRFE